MSNEKTVLPRPVIVSLYRNALYRNIRTGDKGDAGKPIPDIIHYLGNNSKKVLLIVRFESEAFIPDRHFGFVAKMLSACNMNIGDVAIINDKSRNLTLDTLYEQLQPLYTILFGIDPRELDLSIDLPPFTITTFKNCQIFYTPSLDALNQETGEAIVNKKKLWGCLKQAFQV